jgi:release factor glutamine methyltransferase
MKTWTILEVLDWTKGHFEKKGSGSPRLDAEVLISHALSLPRVMLYAKFDQPLTEPERARIRELVERRAKGEPVAYLTGEKEFWSKPFSVTADVLIPRPDSELIVELGASLMKGRHAPVIVDVGTGSGCLAVALASEVAGARVFALDVSPAACAIALQNAERNAVSIAVIESDLLANLPPEAQPIDLLVANLPYVPTAQIATLMNDVKSFEPRLALDGGLDGLDLYRRLIPELSARMAPDGAVLLEADPEQQPALQSLLAAAGFSEPTSTKDLAGNHRVTTARWARPKRAAADI